MKLFDIYRHKTSGNIIQIECFATHMNKLSKSKDSIVVFSNIEKHNDFEIGSCPSFNGYGTREEIESEYDLLVPQEHLDKYSDWNEIFALNDIDNADIINKRE